MCEVVALALEQFKQGLVVWKEEVGMTLSGLTIPEI